MLTFVNKSVTNIYAKGKKNKTLLKREGNAIFRDSRLWLGSNKMAATISTTAAQHIASLPKSRGRKCLAQHLGWGLFDEELDMRTAIHLDFLYDNLMFAVEKGFPWDQVCIVVETSDKLLLESMGKSITETLALFKLKMVDLGFLLDGRNCELYAEYLFSTFMRHFKLFEYCFTRQQEILAPHLYQQVETPSPSDPLKTAQDIKLWEYQQAYQNVEKKEAERSNKRLEAKEKTLKEAENKKQDAMNESVSADKPITKESIAQIIQDVLGAHTSAFVDKVKCDLEDMKEDLELKLEKTSIPRPQALGAPPRFNSKPKTPSSNNTPLPKDKENRKKSSGSSRSRASKS